MNPEQIVARLRQYPIAVVCVVLSIACVAYWYFVGPSVDEKKAKELDSRLVPMKRAMEDNENRRLNLDRDLLRAQELSARLDRRLMNFANTQQHFVYFTSTLPQRTGVTTAGGYQLSPEPVNPRAKPSPFSTLLGRVEISGTYPQVISYLRELAAGDFVVHLDSVELSGAAAATAPGATPSMVVRASISFRMLGLK